MHYARETAEDPQASSSPAARKGGTAPGALRERVLANVNEEPPPLRASAARAAGRLLTTRRARLAALSALCAAGVGSVLLLHPFTGASARLGKTLIAEEYRGAHASLRQAGSHAELTVSGMPQAPVGEVYEVWLARRGRPAQPTDVLFDITSDGLGSVEVPGSLRDVDAVAVTAEPVGGSRHPTGPTVLSVLLRGDSGA